MIELALNRLQKYYGATMVLEDITFEVQTTEKVGIVGSNGCGKSTLLLSFCRREGKAIAASDEFLLRSAEKD